MLGVVLIMNVNKIYNEDYLVGLDKVEDESIDLITSLILRHSNENDIVLDPFIGGGTTAVACINSNRNFVGFEMDKNYYQVALNRIKDAEYNTK